MTCDLTKLAQEVLGLISTEDLQVILDSKNENLTKNALVKFFVCCSVWSKLNLF